MSLERIYVNEILGELEYIKGLLRNMNGFINFILQYLRKILFDKIINKFLFKIKY